MSRKFYTVKQVADALGFSTNTVYKYLEEGRIQATRLGGEGRFRISERELARLLGERGTPPITQASSDFPQQPSPPAEATQPEPQQEEQYDTESLSVATKLGNPNLFNWFIASLAIFVGFSSLLFPYYTQSVSFEPYIYLNQVIKISLIGLALIHIVFQLFFAKRKLLNLLFQVLLGLSFILLGLPAFQTGNYLNAWGNVLIGASVIIFSVIKINDFLKFFLLTLTVSGMAALVIALYPQLFPHESLGEAIRENTSLFLGVWITFYLIVMLAGVYGYLRSPKLLALSMFLIAIGSAFYATLSTSQGFWEQGVNAIVFCSFAVIFSFYKKFDSVSKYSRKELVESFVWFVAVLVAGIVLVTYVQSSYFDLAYKENERALSTARAIILNHLQQAQDDVSRFGTDQRLIIGMSQAEKDKDSLDSIAKGFYSNSSVLRRILIVDKDGKGVSIYPDDPTFSGLNLADRDYFYQARITKKMVVSDVLKPRIKGTSSAVVIGFPLFDENNNFLGVVGGSVDFEVLKRRLDEAKFGIMGEFVISDAKKRIIMADDPNLILKPVNPNGALSMAVDGKSGNTQSYDEDGSLSIKTYAPVEPYGWGLKAQQPTVDLVKNNSRTSFLIFIVTIISGIGSLLSALYFRR